MLNIVRLGSLAISGKNCISTNLCPCPCAHIIVAIAKNSAFVETGRETTGRREMGIESIIIALRYNLPQTERKRLKRRNKPVKSTYLKIIVYLCSCFSKPVTLSYSVPSPIVKAIS